MLSKIFQTQSLGWSLRSQTSSANTVWILLDILFRKCGTLFIEHLKLNSIKSFKEKNQKAGVN